MDSIDVHAHGFPEAYLRQLAATYPAEVQVEEASGTTPLTSLALSQAERHAIVRGNAERLLTGLR